MSIPIANYATNVSTNINICQLKCGQPSNFTPGSQFSCLGMVIDLAQYCVAGGTTGVGTTVTFQELMPDGTWVALSVPTALSITNSGVFNGILNGPFLGLRMAVSGVVGNGVASAFLIASVRGN